MSKSQPTAKRTLDDLFPKGSRLLLTGGGKEFIERIGVDAAKRVVLGVLKGENVRTQTEPLTRRRLAQVSGAVVSLFAHGWREIDNFTGQLSNLAVEQLETSNSNDRTSIWLANWMLGLTGKSIQNVLRSNPQFMQSYIADFEAALDEAAAKCRQDIGDIGMTLGFVEDKNGNRMELGWTDITRLTTAIGSLTLTIRGSDKSIKSFPIRAFQVQ